MKKKIWQRTNLNMLLFHAVEVVLKKQKRSKERDIMICLSCAGGV